MNTTTVAGHSGKPIRTSHTPPRKPSAASVAFDGLRPAAAAREEEGQMRPEESLREQQAHSNAVAARAPGRCFERGEATVAPVTR
ncbi:MAG: hypothetical protein IPI73_07555 [Betaproteobacteria bacterium]|nr:hypothetical protein [Betaproteobacteria bacterium]